MLLEAARITVMAITKGTEGNRIFTIGTMQANSDEAIRGRTKEPALRQPTSNWTAKDNV